MIKSLGDHSKLFFIYLFQILKIMKKLLYFLVPFFLFSCVKVDDKKDTSSIIKNSESDDITFIIDLKINQNTNEDLNVFVEEITQNVIDKEDFCLEYAYYI